MTGLSAGQQGNQRESGSLLRWMISNTWADSEEGAVLRASPAKW